VKSDLVQMSSISCILFDLDGTLYDSEAYNEYFDSQMAAIVADFLHADLSEATRLLRERRKEKGTLTRAMESLGINRPEFHRLVAKHVDPMRFLSKEQTTIDLITRLKARGFRVGLVSNSGQELVAKILSTLGLQVDLFDLVVTGSEVEPKPSHQPFLLALAKLKCEKASTVYVGDREEAEILPAHEVGLKTILINRTHEKQSTSKWADATIHELSELESVIETEFEAL
jgi:putative hydrolase of the HAD superfamily